MASQISNAPENPDDRLAALLPQAVAGDQEAMSQLLFSQVDRLTTYIDRRLPANLAGVISAEDIVQQALVKAYQAIERFEGNSIAAFAGWLNRIAKNQLTDYLRRRGNERLDASVKQPGEAKQNDEGAAWLRLSQMMDEQGETPMQSAQEAELSRAVQVAYGLVAAQLPGSDRAEVSARPKYGRGRRPHGLHRRRRSRDLPPGAETAKSGTRAPFAFSLGVAASLFCIGPTRVRAKSAFLSFWSPLVTAKLPSANHGSTGTA